MSARADGERAALGGAGPALPPADGAGAWRQQSRPRGRKAAGSVHGGAVREALRYAGAVVLGLADFGQRPPRG